MKKFYLATFLFLLSFQSLYAQYFVGDITLQGNEAIFTVTPQGGDINGKIATLEYFIRWPDSEGNNFTFTSFINNTTDFPGMDMLQANNQAYDPGYNNQHFAFVGLTAPKLYLNGVTYEVFRTALGGTIPSSFELVADNTFYDPYYFLVYGDGAVDYSPVGVNPFIGGENVSGDFYRKTFSLTILPVTLKTFSGQAIDCSASLKWASSSEVNSDHYEIEHSSDGTSFETVASVPAAGTSSLQHSYSKTLPLTSRDNYYRLKMVGIYHEIKYSNVILLQSRTCSNLAFIVQVIPNPVINKELRMQVTLANEDYVNIKLVDMTGKLIEKFTRHINKGTSEIILGLPKTGSGQYNININSPVNGTITEKILVE